MANPLNRLFTKPKLRFTVDTMIQATTLDFDKGVHFYRFHLHLRPLK